jgi:hypothetical protein
MWIMARKIPAGSALHFLVRAEVARICQQMSPEIISNKLRSVRSAAAYRCRPAAREIFDDIRWKFTMVLFYSIIGSN